MTSHPAFKPRLVNNKVLAANMKDVGRQELGRLLQSGRLSLDSITWMRRIVFWASQVGRARHYQFRDQHTSPSMGSRDLDRKLTEWFQLTDISPFSLSPYVCGPSLPSLEREDTGANQSWEEYEKWLAPISKLHIPSSIASQTG